MAPLDVPTAQSQAAASQRDLIIAQTNLQNAELAVKTTISKNLEEPLASAEIEPTDSFPDPAQEHAAFVARSHRHRAGEPPGDSGRAGAIFKARKTPCLSSATP